MTRIRPEPRKSVTTGTVLPAFGFDIPAQTYIKLYDGMRAGAIPNPKHVLMTGGHYPAEFDNDTREIRVHRVAAERATQDKHEAWLLLTALLHEYGHYIDAVLRQDLADKNPDGSSTLDTDAPDDEGAKFAYEIAGFDLENSSQTIFAQYKSPEFSGSLKVNYKEAQLAVRRSQDEDAQRKESKQGQVEHFSPGDGEHAKQHPHSSFGHRSIETTLGEVDANVFQPKVLKQIYFGNWLRDFSQLIDPKIIRKPSDKKDLLRHVSRDSMTKLVALYAEVEFFKDEQLTPQQKKVFKVTPERLGVYRPVEHIDNPTNNDPKAKDPRSIDPDFEPLPSASHLAVDSSTSMKRTSWPHARTCKRN